MSSSYWNDVCLVRGEGCFNAATGLWHYEVMSFRDKWDDFTYAHLASAAVHSIRLYNLWQILPSEHDLFTYDEEG